MERQPNGTTCAFWRAAILTVGVITLIAFFVTVHDVIVCSSPDLRVRIAGARLLISHYNPYSAEHQNDPRFKIFMWRLTGPSSPYPPTLLLFSAPFCQLSYRAQTLIWFALEWAAMLGSIGLIWKFLPQGITRRFFLISALLFFASSHFWRLHTQRGQYYVFLLFLEVLAWLGLCVKRQTPWFFGVPLGLAAAMRPTIGVAGFLLLVLGRWQAALAFFLSCILFVAVTLPFGGPKLWSDWIVASKELGFAHRSEVYLDEHFGKEKTAPFTAEGVNFPGRDIDVRVVNLSLGGYVNAVMKKLVRNHAASTLEGEARQDQIAFAIAFIIGLLLTWYFRRRLQTSHSLMLVLLTGAALADFFAPVRFSYCDVIFCLPMALIIEEARSIRGMWMALSLFLLAMVLGNGYWTWLTAAQCENLRPTLATAAMVVALALYCLPTYSASNHASPLAAEPTGT